MDLPSEQELKALISLLDDEDAKHLEALCRHILEIGKPAVPYLEARCAAADPPVRGRIEGLLRDIRLQDLKMGFRSLAAAREADLERGAFLISRLGYPQLDEAKYRRWLDETAVSVGKPMAPGDDPRPLLRKLNIRLFEDLGFTGNSHRYYDPDNSYLNRVVDTRRGIPISMSILYILLGRRLGLPLAGAGLPGHFMVLVQWERQPFFLDPFHEGRALTAGQCREFLLSLGYPFHERYLIPCTHRDILARMMHNLISIHHKSGRPRDAQSLTELVDILSAPPVKDMSEKPISPPPAA
jgi:regulator of sirC expression with transglutaminase-like and TPR domain